MNSPTRMIRADDALPMTGSGDRRELVRTDEHIEPVDGIAAVLRYARTHH